MNVIKNAELSAYTTFGVKAKAQYLWSCENTNDIEEAVRLLRTHKGKIYVMGGGSNTLYTNDFDGVVVLPIIKGISKIGESDTDIVLRAGAGEEWDSFVKQTVGMGLHGLENLSGIPGNVGASPVQNVGAYGMEAGERIDNVVGFRISTGEKFEIAGRECKFGYRNSIFKNELKGDVIITHVDFRLSKEGQPRLDYGALRDQVEKNGGPTLANIRKSVMEIRNSKLPDPKVTGNAGSFFKNPEVEPATANKLKEKHPNMPTYPTAGGKTKIAAGWLIEQCGWKGKSKGNAGVHDKQALVLVNRGGATGNEIVELCEAIRKDVDDKFGISLSPEVNFIG